MPGKPIAPAVLKELQRQFNYELGAAYSYLALALWCEGQNFKGFAKFFRKQVEEEHEHADKIMEHLLDRGVAPELQPLAAPRGKFESLLEVATHAQSMEQSNTAGINQAFEAALKENDYPAQVLLHWFINEQVEEEAWTDEMVDRVTHANCCGGLSDLDRHAVKLFSESSEES